MYYIKAVIFMNFMDKICFVSIGYTMDIIYTSYAIIYKLCTLWPFLKNYSLYGGM